VALVCGIAAALLGLVIPALRALYDYAWFAGFGIAGAVYMALTLRRAVRDRVEEVGGEV
jgi:nucleobase:cation symporter-1, NCS1 family